MLSPQARQVLFQTPWLRSLGEADWEQVALLFEEIALPQGTVIFREGERADETYVIVSGAVDLRVGNRKAGRLPPGSTFGVGGLDDEPRLATAEAALDCRLLVLKQAAWKRLAERHPSIWEETTRALLRKVGSMLSGGEEPACKACVFSSETPWPEQRQVLLELAEALERELGSRVAIVTAAMRGSAPPPARPGTADMVLAGDPLDLTAFRERMNTTIGELTAKVPIILVEVHESGRQIKLGQQADILVERIQGKPPKEPGRRGRRVIYLHDRREGPGPPLSGADTLALPADEPERTRAIESLARHVCGRSVGVALGSGAAWGMAHIGVLEVLEEAGIPIDLVAGSSMGAIVGGHYALGISPAKLREIATSVKTVRDFVAILPELLYLAADFNVTRPGMFAGNHFKKVLASMAPITGRTFADLAIPFRAVATDIETGARVEVTEGEIADAIQASFSAPAILSPQRIGDHVLIDGGMVDPVPSETARKMGADLVIAVNVVPPLVPGVRNPLDRAFAVLDRINPLARRHLAERLPNGFDVMVRTLQVMQYQLGNDRAGEADILISPALSEFWVLEFWSAAAMIEKGAQATREALPAIREKLAAWRKAA